MVKNRNKNKLADQIKKIKYFLFLSICLGIISVQAFTQESLTLTTYYPAPYGVYKTLRFFPHDDIDPATACSETGKVYYDDSDNKLYLCKGGVWGSLGSSEYWEETGDTLHPTETIYDLSIGKTTHTPGYDLDVNGKFRADNIIALKSNVTGCDTNLNTNNSITGTRCDYVISIPGTLSNPVIKCSSTSNNPHPGYTEFKVLSCSVKEIIFNPLTGFKDVTVTISSQPGRHINPQRRVKVRGDLTINLLAFGQ